ATTASRGWNNRACPGWRWMTSARCTAPWLIRYHAPMSESASQTRHIFSVTELNNAAKRLLEGQFPAVWIEGEISNLVQPRSGHLYFTLKDDNAQIRAAMFRGNNVHLNFRPKDGVQVLLRGRLSLYAPRGDYQLIVDQMEEAGL